MKIFAYELEVLQDRYWRRRFLQVQVVEEDFCEEVLDGKDDEGGLVPKFDE